MFRIIYGPQYKPRLSISIVSAMLKGVVTATRVPKTPYGQSTDDHHHHAFDGLGADELDAVNEVRNCSRQTFLASTTF